MRSKEDAMDYRYMPEADLPALELQASWIETQRALLVPLPSTRIQEYTQTYGFNKEFINGLINDPEVNTYFHRCVDAGADPKIAANRLVGSVARWCNEKETSLTHVAFSFEQYVDFVQRQQDGSLLSNHAKIVIKEMLTSGKDPATIIEEKNLKPLDPAQVGKWIDELFAQQPDLLTDLQAGTMKPL
jgi:aspartyl-tRNA(Asn)/glutamyl-tRNA(Gln) amidotransferase subunit B